MSPLEIILVIGARPQFIKSAPLCQALLGIGMKVRLLHTGQHYDANMSGVFFEELGIPAPVWNLNCGGNTHGAMTGAMLSGIEEILLHTRPDMVVVVGDTNSTLAGALAAAKLHIPVAHVEAGLRSGNNRMPEEINRICVDHISNLLFCSSKRGIQQLAKEGITAGAEVTGDVMADVFFTTLRRVRETPNVVNRLVLPQSPWALMTMHRAANTDDPLRLQQVFDGIASGGMPVIFPIHPRTCRMMAEFSISAPENVCCIDPVSYSECVALIDRASLVITDSGGLQKEAYWAGRSCIILRAETEWAEIIEVGWGVLTDALPSAIAAAMKIPPIGPCRPELYGDGTAGGRMAEAMAKFLKPGAAAA